MVDCIPGSWCTKECFDLLLQGDAYTGNWLSAIRHTPKLARRLIVSTMSLVAELHPDKTHVLYSATKLIVLTVILRASFGVCLIALSQLPA